MHSTAATSPKSFRRALLWGGASAGILDISAAIVLTLMAGSQVPRMLRGIASAVLGPVSFDLGFATAALGLGMHFAIAFSWTALFLLAARRFPWLLRQPLPTGIAYGALVYLAMYRIVLPLAALVRSLYLANVARVWPNLTLRMLLIHLGCVGLPIALAAWRFAPRSDARTEAGLDALPQADRAT